MRAKSSSKTWNINKDFFACSGELRVHLPFTTDNIFIKDGYPVQNEDGLHVAVYVTYPNISSYPFIPGQDVLQDLKDQTLFIQQNADVTITGMEILNVTEPENRKPRFIAIGIVIGVLVTPVVIMSIILK